MQPLVARDREGADAGRVRREHSLSPHASISENKMPLVAARLACYLPQSGQKTSALDVAISPLGALLRADVHVPFPEDSRGRTLSLSLTVKPTFVSRTNFLHSLPFFTPFLRA